MFFTSAFSFGVIAHADTVVQPTVGNRGIAGTLTNGDYISVIQYNNCTQVSDQVKQNFITTHPELSSNPNPSYNLSSWPNPFYECPPTLMIPVPKIAGKSIDGFPIENGGGPDCRLATEQDFSGNQGYYVCDPKSGTPPPPAGCFGYTYNRIDNTLCPKATSTITEIIPPVNTSIIKISTKSSTQKIEKPNIINTNSSNNSTPQVSSTSITEKIGFWQRIKNFFRSLF